MIDIDIDIDMDIDIDIDIDIEPLLHQQLGFNSKQSFTLMLPLSPKPPSRMLFARLMLSRGL